MKFNKLIVPLISLLPFYSHAQTPGLSLSDVTPSGGSEKSWEAVSDVSFSAVSAGKAKKTSGTGVILYTGNAQNSTLSTKETFGDTEVEFDFAVEKGAAFGVLLQGRYRVNLSDSWATTAPVTADMGGIGPLKQNGGAFTGLAPLMNVARAPGLWQHALIRYRAPKFNGSTKTTNALFEEVYINGVLVQESAEVQAPSAGAIFDNEAAIGPVAFTGSNGQAAIKNIKVSKLAAPVVASTTPNRRIRRVANPILLNPGAKNYLLRSFVNFNGKKRTHVVSVGSPQQVNYCYDVKQGALFQMWHGTFMDVTEMWEQRGEPQLAKPLGSVIPLSEAPALAILKDKETTLWPDSVAFDDLKNMGYTLDKQRDPTFEYEAGGYHVSDKIAVSNADRGLFRTLTVTNPAAGLYCRVAKGATITAAGNGLYIIGDKSYYVQIDEKLKPWVRYSQNGSELLVPVTAGTPVSYSLIW